MVTDSRQQFEKQIAALVEKFSQRKDEYKYGGYTELQARVDFIDPFFEALGWDVRNTLQRPERERDVVVESGQTSGRPDYNFRVDGRTVFFVEAKAPHVPLESSRVILQAKKYAFNETSQEVMLAAATDFEEFRLYEVRDISCLRRVNKGLIFAHHYDEYLSPKALDDLWQLSREQVVAGSLDKLITPEARRARQRIPLDQQFLSDLTEWREKLAKAVFKTQPDLEASDLNSVVQIFLDRLIFIRVAEDRGALARQLLDIAQSWKQHKSRPITAELLPLFRVINKAMNGEIFKPHRCEEIEWDSALVAEIIEEGLESYNFAQIGVELLGSIYERYLGKTIRVTETRAIVDDKPEVRKAGGVYYTPKYIVDYIVAQTAGKLIEGKTPKQIEKLRVLDPACGSGSFLLAAYQTLLDYHTRYFAERASRRGGGGGGNGGQASLLREPQAEYGEFKLSLEQKAQILRNNIFGVDIDPQAVEITMMSLYIKMLEGERGAIVGQGVLPPLKDNIKCGNSLIGYDIGELSEEDKIRVNPFDWDSKREGFGEIMDAGGFDAVIGNPPYGAEFSDVQRA
ncbi:MAG: DNA methyltransferase, partial [Chloroflexota bacterium]